MIYRNRRLISLASFLAVTLLVHLAGAQTVVDISPDKDNTLYEHAEGTLSNGSGEHLFVGNVGVVGMGRHRRTLLRFDIAGNIPEGSMIVEAALTLHMNTTITGQRTVDIHKVLSDWGEGASDAAGEEGMGAPAQAGDATWIHNFFDNSLWSTAGGDFEPSPGASQSVGNIGDYTWESTQLVDDVQGWLDDPQSNFGWILIGDESALGTAKRFDSRENSNPDNHPVLTVTYTGAVAIGERGNRAPRQFELQQNFPNPFNPSTRIRFILSRSETVTLKVYDAAGQEIATLVNQRLPAGSHTTTFEADGLPTGLYFYRLEARGLRKTRKMLLLK